MPIYVLEHRVCDVCRLLDEDTELKNCGFCGLCDSWICQADQTNWSRRLRAFYKRRVEPLYRGQLDYDKLIEESRQLDAQPENNRG